jgi:hypothetical protein
MDHPGGEPEELALDLAERFQAGSVLTVEGLGLGVHGGVPF